MWCSAADKHLKLLDHVNGSSVFQLGVYTGDLSHYYVCCRVYKIRCYPMHPLYGLLPGPYVPRRVTRGVLVAHLYTYATPRCRTSQNCMPFILCQYLGETILVTPYPIVFDWWVSRPGPMFFYWPSCSLPFCLLLFSLSLLSLYGLVLWGWGLRSDRILIVLSQPCIANLF